MEYVKLFEQFISEGRDPDPYDNDPRAPWNQEDVDLYAEGDIEFDIMMETLDYADKANLEKFISDVDSLIGKEMKKNKVQFTLANPLSDKYGMVELDGDKYDIRDGLAWNLVCTIKENVLDSNIDHKTVEYFASSILPNLKQIESLARKYKIKFKKVYIEPLEWEDLVISYT